MGKIVRQDMLFNGSIEVNPTANRVPVSEERQAKRDTFNLKLADFWATIDKLRVSHE